MVTRHYIALPRPVADEGPVPKAEIKTEYVQLPPPAVPPPSKVPAAMAFVALGLSLTAFVLQMIR